MNNKIDPKKVRILWLGTPEISSIVLEKLINDGYNIIGVVASIDKPVGRKQEILPVPTKKVAIAHNIPVYQPLKIRLDYEFVKEINPDLILCMAYGQIIPQGLLDIPKFGCLNLHGSLLPKYRGAATIQYSLINNDKLTGITLMQMSAGMDEGAMLATKVITIDEEDNYSSLKFKLAQTAYEICIEQLDAYVNGRIMPINQDSSKATYCKMIKKEDEKLDLSMPISQVVGYIRGLSDEPGAYLLLDGNVIKIFKARVYSPEVKGGLGKVNAISKGGIVIQGSDGEILLTVVQKQGKNKVDAYSFANGYRDLLEKS